ncbi:hypothetical protein EVAR_83734_1 [Eumeta japonica]|uniref:Uncharacterized protein n=1 Tax=Eumeta variegata TaxID=151549 RepID=A0A4C1WAG6_EUMVA|nr:hypothetical protein EVAR_83734_1 [Eumeta japonica]
MYHLLKKIALAVSPPHSTGQSAERTSQVTPSGGARVGPPAYKYIDICKTCDAILKMGLNTRGAAARPVACDVTHTSRATSQAPCDAHIVKSCDTIITLY